MLSQIKSKKTISWLLMTIATASMLAVPSLVSADCGSDGHYIVGYYPSWKRAAMQNLSWNKLTHLQLAFGIPKSDGSFSFEGDWFTPQVVQQAHDNKVRVTLSIGGWTGSNLFSTIMKSDSAKSTMTSSIVDYIRKNGLDGVDIDWEYPGRLGNDCNVFDPQNDTPNFEKYLRDLRGALDKEFGTDPTTRKLISLAVRVTPFDGPNGPLDDVSGIAESVDFASVMAFDINGAWSDTTGPNAPFEYIPGKGLSYSFKQAIDQWLAAKWPADKLVAGTAFYGRAVETTQDMSKDTGNMYVAKKSGVPHGDKDDAYWYDTCARTNSLSGVWQYANLRGQGLLTSPTQAGGEWIRTFDEKSQTPWLFNPSTSYFISYDDPQSLKHKAEYARNKGLKGMMTWSLNGDYQDELLDALNTIGPLCHLDGTTSSAPPNKNPTQPSNPSGGGSSSPAPQQPPTTAPPAQGGTCTVSGQMTCSSGKDSNGKDTTFKVCSNGSWISMPCGSGTGCYQSGDNQIYCGAQTK
ncbi:hypothetical protein H4219_002594 [Mycoemilia scoparia]|uniref:GH18 domain-containing protein n=1 Tax=Mycoemilia scoparia TaxID=417184 RepID=A0A9W8A3L1_9FUNG|nr:hypothetical protein H4219_002594 [Mycoemilia scoparia]